MGDLRHLLFMLLAALLVIGTVYVYDMSTTQDQEINQDKVTLMLSLIEAAYFEGQKDAINGDIRIQHDGNCNYSWKSSPWDSGMETTFDPGANPNIVM